MDKKKLWMVLGALAIVGGGTYYAVPSLHDGGVVSSKEMKMKEFKELKDTKFEVLDTAGFADKNLEKWFKENEAKKGEHLYFDNKYSYVLISPGENGSKDETIWFDGMRTTGDTNLVVGYSFVNASDLGIKLKNDGIRTLLVRTKGEFKTVQGVQVEKEKAKSPEPNVTEEKGVTEDSDSGKAKDAKEKDLDVKESKESKDSKDVKSDKKEPDVKEEDKKEN